MGIAPDIVTLAKSLSGMGLPVAVVLLKPEHDVWAPGEHNGTFRGNNHAFVTARVALEKFWRDDRFSKIVRDQGAHLAERLDRIAGKHGYATKGRGMRSKERRVGQECVSTCRSTWSHFH